MDGLGISPTTTGDLLDADQFDAALGAARDTAVEVVAGMRAGEIRREPLGGDCGYCEYSSVCRIERAARINPEEPERDDEARE